MATFMSSHSGFCRDSFILCFFFSFFFLLQKSLVKILHLKWSIKGKKTMSDPILPPTLQDGKLIDQHRPLYRCWEDFKSCRDHPPPRSVRHRYCCCVFCGWGGCRVGDIGRGGLPGTSKIILQRERIQRKDRKRGEMTVLLLDMLLIWRSWQKAGRQRGRASGVLTQSQETGSTCHPVPAWGPATISLHLHIPSAHEGAKGRAPSPAPACAASLGFYLRTRSPSGSH